MYNIVNSSDQVINWSKVIIKSIDCKFCDWARGGYDLIPL